MNETQTNAGAGRAGRDQREKNPTQNVRVQRVGDGCVARITFQDGDTLIWTRGPGVFAAPGESPTVLDLWRVQEGETALVTNRADELPNWFTLTPSERMSMESIWAIASSVTGAADIEPMETPQVWRVLAGDRIAWVGGPRDDNPSTLDFYQLFVFEENAIVIGAPTAYDNGFPSFGMPEGEFSREQVLRGARALAAIRALGAPRVISADDTWRL